LEEVLRVVANDIDEQTGDIAQPITAQKVA
jgi:hypothetical protein